MKLRLRKIVNFFAFNLLFFALYLNFIHKDNNNIIAPVNQVSSPAAAAAFSGAVLVVNPEKYTNKQSAVNAAVTGPAVKASQDAGLTTAKLAVN